MVLEEVKIDDAIEASNSELASTNKQIKKADEMIKRANFLLFKAMPIRAAETVQLEQLAVVFH